MVIWSRCIDGSDDAWSRAARRVVCLAAERQIVVHDDLLVASDVRDLQALALRLEGERTRSWPWERGHGAATLTTGAVGGAGSRWRSILS